jgi:predicted nucleic-acid-binding protein
MLESFLDANVILRHLLQDHVEHSPRATSVIRRIEQGNVRVRTISYVVFEVVFTLERSYKLPKSDIAAAVIPIVNLPGILLPNKRLFNLAFDVYVRHNVPFADSYYAAFMHLRGMTDIISFDRDFDRIPGITRTEP